jgi:hypothetical protein
MCLTFRGGFDINTTSNNRSLAGLSTERVREDTYAKHVIAFSAIAATKFAVTAVLQVCGNTLKVWQLRYLVFRAYIKGLWLCCSECTKNEFACEFDGAHVALILPVLL